MKRREGFGVLRRAADFRRLREQGRSVRANDVVAVYLINPDASSRLAVVASKRVGSAVRRNRAKRLLREAHRHIGAHCVNGLDLMLIARSGAARSTCRAIESQLANLYRLAGLLESGSAVENGEPNAPA